jgi:AbrB family looped-hinge helix DNA binding protein
MMPNATITSKGQVTLPKEVRDRLGLRAGDRIEFVETERGFVVVPATQDIRSIKGIVPRPRKPVSIEEMNRAIRRMGADE